MLVPSKNAATHPPKSKIDPHPAPEEGGAKKEQ